MSKELEALNILRENHIQFSRERYGKLDKETLQNIINRKLARWDILEEAIKRNEPMEVIVHRYNFQRYNFETSDYWAEFYCPKCETVVSIGDKFCSECGQALEKIEKGE